MIKIKDIPIYACDKAPKDKPYLLPNWMKICPFCGKALKDHK